MTQQTRNIRVKCNVCLWYTYYTKKQNLYNRKEHWIERYALIPGSIKYWWFECKKQLKSLKKFKVKKAKIKKNKKCGTRALKKNHKTLKIKKIIKKIKQNCLYSKNIKHT